MYNRYRSTKKYRSFDYVMPFLIIICIGVIFILIFNLWRSLFHSENMEVAYMYISEGSAQMKPWGTNDFFDLSSDVLIMQGDEIRASKDAKIIVEFFDGTLMRIDGGSDVGFESIDDSSKKPAINVNLMSGNLWFNKVYKNTQSTEIVVVLDDVEVNSNEGSIFEIENGDNEIVRVLSVFGNEGVGVDILSEDKKSVVETENVGVGQEITFSDEVLDRYWKFQSPTVLSGIFDEFKIMPWYIWNINEDLSPTKFEKYAGAEGQGLVKALPESVAEDGGESDGQSEAQSGGEVFAPNGTRASGSDENLETVDEGTENAISGIAGESAKPAAAKEESAAVQNLGPLTIPVLTSVSGGTQVDENGFYKVTGNIATITGTISGAAKVVVNGYTLQRFKPGDGTWTYFANADYDLMKAGENFYEVHGIDVNGNPGTSITVKVFYDKPAAAVPEPAAEPVLENPEVVEGT